MSPISFNKMRREVKQSKKSMCKTHNKMIENIENTFIKKVLEIIFLKEYNCHCTAKVGHKIEYCPLTKYSLQLGEDILFDGRG